jgi:holo-[acyl-carrier protein] synthase
VVRQPGERPAVRFSGKAAEFAERLGCKRAHLSLTHTAEQAMAFVVLEGD